MNVQTVLTSSSPSEGKLICGNQIPLRGRNVRTIVVSTGAQYSRAYHLLEKMVDAGCVGDGKGLTLVQWLVGCVSLG